MQKRLIAATCLLALSACADSPMSPNGAPEAPRRNEAVEGGWTAGSGNKVQPTTDTATTTTTAGACEPDERGGWTAGSGNIICVKP